MTTAERRALERFKLQLLSRIKVKDKEVIDLLTRDVSAGGAFITTTEPLKVGAHADIDLIIKMDRLADADDHAALVNLTGTVIRTDAFGMAVCFDEKYKVTRLKNQIRCSHGASTP